MKAIYINYMKCTLALLMGVLLVGCDNAVFSNDGGDSNKVTDLGDPDDPTDPNTPDLFFFEDSFERNDIYMDLAEEIIYGWRGFILDNGTSVFGFNSNGAGARIPTVGEFGPASDGQRFLLLNGNEDAEVETVQVISQGFDLSAFNTVVLNFDYMTFGLNDAGDAPESLKVQVCSGTPNECGANDDILNAAGLQSAHWVDVAVNNPAINDDNFNGKNHSVSDWQEAEVVINLRDTSVVGNPANFIFRIVAVMNDGVNNGTCPPDARATASTSTGHNDHKDDCKHKHDCKKHKECKKDCKHKDCKDCKKHDCKKHKDCKHKCPDDCVPGDGTLKDGAAVDNIRATATVQTSGDR